MWYDVTVPTSPSPSICLRAARSFSAEFNQKLLLSYAFAVVLYHSTICCSNICITSGTARSQLDQIQPLDTKVAYGHLHMDTCTWNGLDLATSIVLPPLLGASVPTWTFMSRGMRLWASVVGGVDEIWIDDNTEGGYIKVTVRYVVVVKAAAEVFKSHWCPA